MGGGLMQLVAYGAQDIYLTGNPQITFFKVVYRRHTNFSIEAIPQQFNGSIDFGSRVNTTISRNGDLVHRMYIKIDINSFANSDLPAGKAGRWLNWLGHTLTKKVRVDIGGHRIDEQTGEFMHLWNELTRNAGHKVGYASMVGNVPRLTQFIKQGGNATTLPATTLYVPLQFWFCRNPGLALPLISLQYHEVRISVDFNELDQCFYCEGGTSSMVTKPSFTAELLVDYVYLDTDERRRFAQVAHEYLIEQVQASGNEDVTQTNASIKLNFNHPVKELVWVAQPYWNVDSHTDNHGGPQLFNFTDSVDPTYFSGTPGSAMGEGMVGPTNPNWGIPLAPHSLITVTDANTGLPYVPPGNTEWSTLGVITAPATITNVEQVISASLPFYDPGVDPVVSATVKLNGSERFREQEGRYFNLIQPYQHHTNIPAEGIHVYSFALKPEEHQPSGSCNFSRIDSARLQLTMSSNFVSNSGGKVRVYATNYNVLRIMSGMGGLAYTN